MYKSYFYPIGVIDHQGTKVSKIGELTSRDVSSSGRTNFLTLVDDLATAVRQPVLSLAYTVKVNQGTL